MHSASDENKVKQCMTRMIDAIQQCIQKLNRRRGDVDGTPTRSSATADSDDDQFNPHANIFTLDNEEKDLLNELTEDIENILNGCLPCLTSLCSTSFIDFLRQYGYDGEEQKFDQPLIKNRLAAMLYELKGLQASRAAFAAAVTGEQATVKKFIEDYPILKNKPNFWGPTLLYTAAFNNQLDLVKFLVDKGRCDVDARNWCQMNSDGSLSAHETRNPVLGSTALHAACANNNLRIVEYLVAEKNADYFIKNQANKTPIDYGEQHAEIKRFFQNYLVISYLNPSSDRIPKTPITLEDDVQQDCIWEYKPSEQFQWETFSKTEADTLHRELSSGRNISDPIQFPGPQGSFSVSLATFLRTDKNGPKSPGKQSSVRCRGSSVLNFHIAGFWQLMFTRYPKSSSNTTTRSTDSVHIGSIDSDCAIELDKWYTSDPKTNWTLNYAMNIRRKIVLIDIHLGGNEQTLRFDLSLFTLGSEDKSVFGYIRWIPKLISNDKRNKDKTYEVDNFKLKPGTEILPLISERKLDTTSRDGRSVDGGDEMDTKPAVEDDDADDDDDDDTVATRKNKAFMTEKWLRSLREINDDELSTLRSSDDSHSNASSDAKRIEPPNGSATPSHDDVGPKGHESHRKTRDLSSDSDKNHHKTRDLSSDSDETHHKTRDLSSDSDETHHKTDDTNSNDGRRDSKDWDKKITTKSNYRTKPVSAMETYLLGKGQLIVKHLNGKQRLPDYYVDKIPKLFFDEHKSGYSAILTGVSAHHSEFDRVLERISKLSSATEHAKSDCQRQLAKTADSVVEILKKRVRPVTQRWRHYTDYFLQILKDKKQQYDEQFDEYMTDQSKLLAERTITDDKYDARPDLKKAMEQYEKSNSFISVLEKVKHEALEEFIEQQIYLPRQQFERKPSKASLKVLNDFIEDKKKEMKTDNSYKGLEVKPFKLLAKLLQSMSIYNHCFQLQLPLFESAPELMKKIQENTVVTISTSTGSGKSTLLPALLIAEGYDRVLVTQPRRLPCTAICKRVNSTMTSEDDQEVVAGWAVSGAEHDTNAPILYLTDGLLKGQLLHDDALINEKTTVDKAVVFFLDEVHERSINIDLCLALLARLLARKPQLKSKMKLIISSATLDRSVPTLFRHMNQLKFDEFQMPKLGTLYPVTKHRRPNDNVLALVQELNKVRQRDEQILCFVSSVHDVNMGCRLLQELSSGSIVAYPLIQAQSSTEQQKFIEQGSIFFSTTVAETSLTFPSLRYVIDTGMISLPIYDFKTQQTVLEKVRAAESTIKQRLGRLGRTQPGDYYALYDFEVEEKKFPTPQICQSELSNIELSLRTAPSQEGLNQLKQFLPDKPTQQAIDFATARLRRFNIITPPPNEQFTKEGAGIAKLPDFSSIEMSKAVYAALTRYRCGHDLIAIASMLGVLNTSAVLTTIPNEFKSPDGDFMTILNVMNAVLNAKKSTPSQHFKLRQFCQRNNLDGAYQTLNKACRRYETLEKTFSISKEFRSQSQIRSGQWELIAKSLLKGYSDNVFVSLKELQGRTHRFTRYQSSKSDIDVAILDKQSTLNRSTGSAPVSLVLARDIRYATSIRAKAILSFVGELKATWIEYEVEREINLNDKEKWKLNAEKVLPTAAQKFPDVEIQMKNDRLSISGPSGSVLNAELFILQSLVEDMKFSSTTNLNPNTEEYQALRRNMEGIIKMVRVFNPMKWRWENEEQVKINLEEGPDAQLDVTVTGRNSKNRKVQDEFRSSFNWLRHCAVLRTPNSDIPPRLLIPQVRHKYLDVEERISRVTDSKRTTIDLWNGLQGPDATRETRMEVVAWITICKFGCKLEGGFVRDWIVGHHVQRPKGENAHPSKWISYRKNSENQPIPSINQEVVPADLDCHLPIFAYFDIDKFLDFIHKYQIECKVVREQWRFILLFDENTKTGPFIMDLIEPHVALTHDRIDFDVNNLLVEKDYTKELGMRVDIENPPYSIDLETIVDRIRQKKLQILRPIDDILQERIKKMVDLRGWTIIKPSLHVIPRPPGKHRVVVVSLPPTSDLYKEMVKVMQSIPNAQVLKVEQIRNPGLEELYLGMKKLIQSQCEDNNVNERLLFHGTKGPAIDGIRDYGYDDRFTGGNTAKGDWGHGAYFADRTHSHAHWHTEPNEQDRTRVMYYNKVLLGTIYIMPEINRELNSAPLDHHSIHGIHPDRPDDDEFIVYRYGQALPYLKITYLA